MKFSTGHMSRRVAATLAVKQQPIARLSLGERVERNPGRSTTSYIVSSALAKGASYPQREDAKTIGAE